MSGGDQSRIIAACATWAEGLVLGNFVLGRRIGIGGMAEVYDALHTLLGSRVAIKRLHIDASARPGVGARFLREGRAAAMIRHPHVVRVIDVGTHEGAPYLVMEYLEGENLEQHLATRGALPIHDAIDLLLPILSALKAAHAAGVIHRDLKPANVVLARDHGGRAHPVLVDFGIARAALGGSDGVVTVDDSLLGTPAYLAPEQCLGATNATAASDQYALAVILYRCLTGRLPFIEPSLPQLLGAIGRKDIPSPRSLRPDLPEALDAAVRRGLARDPSSRHADLSSFAELILPFASARGRASWASLEAPSDADAASLPPSLDAEVHPTPVVAISELDRVAPARRTRRWQVAAVALCLVAMIATFAAFVRPSSGASSTGPRSAVSLNPVDGGITAVAPTPAPSVVAPLPGVPAATAVPLASPRRQRVTRVQPARQSRDAGVPRSCFGPNGVNLCL